MRPHGFTLMEVIVVATLVTVLSLLGLTVLRSSSTSIQLSRAQSLAQRDLRAVLTDMTHELEMAAKTDRDDVPGVLGVQLNDQPVPPDATDVDQTVVRELVFQCPSADIQGEWTGPITYRFINEDTNKNGLLDDGESDQDFNFRPTSLIERREDINGDGDFDDAGERRVLGSAQTITDAEFVIEDDVVTVTLESTCAVAGTTVIENGGDVANRVVRCSLSTSIYPLN